MEKGTDPYEQVRETLRELILSTIICGVIMALIGVWFSASKPVFLLSWSAGLAGSIAIACHMKKSVEYAMEMPEGSAGKYMRRNSLLRSVCVMVLVVAAYFLKGNIVAIFIGLLALKPGAYVQPLVHRFIHHVKKGR